MREASVHRVVLEPGNCTRYDLDVIQLGPYDLLVILYKNRERISGRAMKFSSTSMRNIYKPQQVSQTMGCDMTEAAVILAYLRTVHGTLVDIDSDFNQDTGVWVGHTIH